MKEDNQQNNTSEETELIIPQKGKGAVLYPVIAFCVPVLLYLQTVKFAFTDFDDKGIITNNIHFLSHFRNIFRIFITDAFVTKISLFYRPMQTLSYMTDVLISGGNNPWMYHLTNVLLFGLTACALYFLLRRFLIPPLFALLATLIYCDHPLFISTVAWIPARGDLMLTLFSLLSFLFFIQFLQKGKIIYLLLNWIAFTLALFCKETAALLPFLFIIYYFAFSFEKHFEKKHLFTVILYGISGACWMWLRHKAIGGFSNPADLSGIAAIITNLQTIPEAVAKLFTLTGIAPFPAYSFLNTTIGIGILAVMIVFFFLSRQRTAKEKIFCFSWFLILMFPAMLYKQPLIEYLDHRSFLPLMGILLFLLFIFPTEWTVYSHIKHYWYLIVILVFLGSFSSVKSHSYSSPMVFYNSAISQNSNCAIAYYGRGKIKIYRSDYEAAIDDFSRAIALHPAYSEAYNSRGFANLNMGYKKKALDDYNKAVELCPTYYQAYFGRGNVKQSLNDFQGAVNDFDRAISLNPAYEDAYTNRGVAKYSAGNYKEAIDDFDKAISINPNSADAYNSKGIALGMTGKLDDAIINFNKVISIDPKYWKAYSNRSFARYFLKDFKGAMEDCDKVLEINADDEKAAKLKAKAQQELQKAGH